jgi:hypothetical protein
MCRRRARWGEPGGVEATPSSGLALIESSGLALIERGIESSNAYAAPSHLVDPKGEVMRSFRAARLLVLPALALPLLLSAVLLPGTAWAKSATKPVKCPSVTGTYGSTWYLMGCSQPGKQGGYLVIGTGNDPFSTPFLPSAGPVTATVTWGELPNPSLPHLKSTVHITTTQLSKKKDKCGTGTEYLVTGSVVSNSKPVGIKLGKLKMFVCNNGGALSAHKKFRF